MATNPLFQTGQNPDEKPEVKEPKAESKAAKKTSDSTPAVELIRAKVSKVYEDEPDAKEEIQEVEIVKPRSRHQQFIFDLQAAGKNLAEIQTAWHKYYMELPDAEKHEVWKEFYDSYEQTSKYNKFVKKQAEHGEPANIRAPVVSVHEPEPHVKTDLRPTQKIKSEIVEHAQKATAKRRPKKKKGILHSLGFGLAMGSLVIIIFLFGLFNEFIIAPFIQPGRAASNIPLIINTSSFDASKPEVIIPKINVEIPVDYNETTDDENVMENALQSGVVHYPSTVMPGQKGNAAFFGHSSNNIFAPGKYKYAFVLLHDLTVGDTFYLTYNGKLYVYQVISRIIVPPTDVGVLNDTHGQVATASLITCDPPGTSWNRLVVTGKQISPAPSTATAPTTTYSAAQPQQIIGNGPSLWSRFWHWLF